MHTCVLAIDPGMVTGVAWHRILAGVGGDRDEFGSAQFDRYEFNIWLDWELSNKGSIDLVIFEQFNLTRATPLNYSNIPIEIIGHIKGICESYDVEWKSQSRQFGKNLGTNTRLRKLGWLRSQMPHATDAARHLLAYRLTEGWTSSLLDPTSNSA